MSPSPREISPRPAAVMIVGIAGAKSPGVADRLRGERGGAVAARHHEAIEAH